MKNAKKCQKNKNSLQKIVDGFDNKKNLRESVNQIKNNLTRRAKIA
ncbi:hypothetical protein BD31_I0360 [Candidatus Nitrosopumilus salaria BD31]|uniref:Uncharacterized protein n=1 Tax=Candidatus Nitrosopumilus salarius BD31 TaxID=859350 RepID=I3D3G8_9ARCH|nr:hypothetical protein BD31_I0360 [Candidatus Nitrosopumilus salaria BD31]